MRTVLIGITAVAAVVVAGTAASAQSIESAYTTFETSKCSHVRGLVPEDYGHLTCKGYGGIAVWVAGADQRVYVSFGPRAKNEPAAMQTFSAFNSEGRTIEWRIERRRDGKARPFATILRWNTSPLDENANQIRGQVLVVTRLAPGPVCHVGYVDGRANPNANELAREIADQHARRFRCATDKPIMLGEKGPGFSPPYGSDPD
jgi:hypothetical protein